MIVAAPSWKGQYLPFGAVDMSVAPPVRIGGKWRGLSGTCPAQSASIFTNPGLVWDYILNGCPTPIGVPGAPTGSALTLAPANEADAAAAAQVLANQQLSAQQQLNAAGVVSSPFDAAASGIVDTAAAAGQALLSPGGVSWWVWLAGGIGILALVAAGGGRPRRYGR